jgi:hypothetical protein
MNPATGPFKGTSRSRYFVRTVFRHLNDRTPAIAIGLRSGDRRLTRHAGFALHFIMR